MSSPSKPAPKSHRPRRAVAAGARLLHLSAVAVTLLVALLLGLAMLPNVWGWSSMVVTSGSMEPALSPGDVVLVAPREASTLEPMDIITFMTEDGVRVTHRVVDKGTDADGTSFVTKGDANEEADGGVVDARNVTGQVHYSVPRVGYLIAWARTPLGLVLLVLALGYVAFGGRSRQARDGEAAELTDSSELVRS
jgi:signal peptidase